MKKLHLLWRAVVFVTRDVFIGFIVGVCAAVLLSKVNPGTHRVVALLIPAGVLAGIFKGITKFIFLNIFSALPSKGNRYNYPKFKLLILWGFLLFGTLSFSYGLNLKLWFSEPSRLLMENIFLSSWGTNIWVVLAGLISTAGILAHFYEPPYNEDEFLPPEAEAE